MGKESSNFDILEDSGEDRFASLGLKLSIPLSVMLKEIHNEVTTTTAQKEHAASLLGRMLKGRQIELIIFTFFKRNPQMGAKKSVTDLAKLDWMGVKKAHKFFMMWRLILDQTQTIPPVDEFLEILTQKMEKSVVLREYIAHYYRMDEGHGDKNYSFLIRSMENYMDRERYKTNRANDFHSMPSLAQRDGNLRTDAPSVVDAPGGNGPSEASERRKTKKQKQKAKAAAKAAAAPAPTPAGKGKGKGKEQRRNECYYFNQPGGCPKTIEECWFTHKKLSAAEVAQLVQPPSRAGSRGASPFGGKAGAKAAPKANATGRKSPSYCFRHMKPGGGNDANCEFMHLGESMVGEFKRAGKVLQDNANARP